MDRHSFYVNVGSILRVRRKAEGLTLDADRGSKERMAQIYACAGANRIAVDELCAGDIGCK